MKKDKSIVGLTGISGAGKTIAAGIFAENGFTVIDCDKEARRIIAASPCSEAVKQAFPEVYNESGEMDRVKMSRLVFSDREKLKEYEKIIFPYITREILGIISKINAEHKEKILLDAPALFQSGADRLCGKIVAVAADREICLRRIMQRDKISESDALLRLNSQPGADFFKENADIYIENNGGEEEFIIKIKEAIGKVL